MGNFGEERRKEHRLRSYLAGQAVFNGRASTVDCLLRNISDDGAKITFSDGVALPVEFEITIPRRGETKRSRVVWRTQKEAGLKFLPPPSATFLSLEAARQVRKLKEDRDALSRRVAELSEPTY